MQPTDRRAWTIAAAVALAASAVAAPAGAQDARARGGVDVEWRGFPGKAASAGPSQQDGSIVLSGTVSVESTDRHHLFTIEPFLRIDSADSRRTHLDLRSLSWTRTWRDVELRAGVRRVFWGVTESRHLVDVINQTDLVENADGEDKLGQPMVNVAWFTPLGTIDAFLLTGFRQRTFPGERGRLRPPVVVDPDLAEFERDGLARHLGWAVRWSRVAGGWDLGVSHFSGTSRAPRLVPNDGPAGTPVLVPYYGHTDQTGLDAQLTSGSWLWKLEGITRTGHPDGRQWAMVGGVEYTVYQVFGTAADLGLLGEVLLDTRDTEPFQDDLFAGGRLALNDASATTVLAGVIVDRRSGGTLLNIEASRRLNSAFSVAIEIRGFLNLRPSDPIAGLAQDDHVLVRLSRFF